MTVEEELTATKIALEQAVDIAERAVTISEKLIAWQQATCKEIGHCWTTHPYDLDWAIQFRACKHCKAQQGKREPEWEDING